jgi:hypothetical protein
MQSSKIAVLRERGGALPWKMVSETQLGLGKAFNRLKYWKLDAAADDAVMIYDMTSWVQFDPKNSG